MAKKKIQGLTIEIGGDTTELSKALKKPNLEVSDLNSKLSAINQSLKLDPTNVNILEQKFRILGQAVDKNEERLQILKNAQEQFIKSGKDIDSAEYIELQKQIIQTTTRINKLKNSQDDVKKSLNDIGSSSSGVNTVNNKLKKLDDSLEDVEKSSNTMTDALKGAFIGSGIVEGIEAIISSLGNMVEESKETIKIMSSLGVSSKLSGYSINETKESYEQLYGVLGDNQTTATTLANLQALGLEQDKLNELIEGTIGSWAKYGDSIPIDGLAESINETVKTSKVTGTFADVLNWAGTSEDDFNAKLEKTKSSAQRANLILDELNKQGLTEAAMGWRENAGYLVDLNVAQSKWEQATASISERIMPYFAMVKSSMADMLTTALQLFTGEIPFDDFSKKIETFGTEFANNFPKIISELLTNFQNIGDFFTQNAPTFIKKGFEMLSNIVKGIIDALPIMIKSLPKIITTFANIINDNFPTILLKGAELLWQLITGILSAIPDLIANIPQIIEAIWSTIMAFNWLNLGKNIVEFLGNGIKSMFNFIKLNASGVAKNIWNSLTHLPQTLWNLGKDMISKMGTSITNTTGTVGGAIKGVFNTILSGFKSLPSKMLDIGKNIVRGIIKGIDDMAGWVLSKIKGFGNSILKGIKSFFGIHSPSVVMENVVGKNIAAGVGKGIINNANLALNPLKQLQKEMTSSFDPNISAAVSKALNYNGTITVESPINVNLDGKPIYSDIVRRTTQNQSMRTIFQGGY